MTISASAQRFAKLGESIYLENAGRALNVGTGSERSIDQLAWLVQPALGGRTELRLGEQRRGEVRQSAISPAKAQQQLGWTPRTALADGLNFTIGWLRSRLKGL